MNFHAKLPYHHPSPERTAVVLVNLGTPDAPTPSAVRRYLAEFLSDPRVIEQPRWFWLPLLHGVILNIRPRRSAHAYQQIWTDAGSPLAVHTDALAKAVDAELAALQPNVQVVAAMRYGNPNLRDVLRRLHDEHTRRVLIIPLYPQYSATTTASVFDAVADELKTWRWLPELRFLPDYYRAPGYIDMLADNLRPKLDPSRHLLFSFHGIPERYVRSGDPYHCQSLATARRVAEALGRPADSWSLSFQSRVGRERWLSPYTDAHLKDLAARGVRHLDVACPGFAVDCLETLEEIAMQNRELFLSSGGESFTYHACLNSGADHASFLAKLALAQCRDWFENSRVAPTRAAFEAHLHQHADARRLAADVALAGDDPASTNSTR